MSFGQQFRHLALIDPHVGGVHSDDLARLQNFGGNTGIYQGRNFKFPG